MDHLQDRVWLIMNQLLDKKTILKKTAQVGGTTLLSRAFGLAREILKAHYLGTSAMADAFFVAFLIPNSLRKIFAEGALTAAFVPTIVSTVNKQDDQHVEANALMTLSFLVFEGILTLLCLVMFFNATAVVSFVAGGFAPEKIAYTAKLFQILCTFILFVSSSALLAGALQSVNHFLIPALGPVLLNVIFIGAVLINIWLDLPVTYLCYAILLGGVLNFVMHLVAYFKMGFGFHSITQGAKDRFRSVLTKFFPVMFSMSIMEINLFIDTTFSSYLPDGSVSIINYANRFMGIPLGVFAVAFSTILLPHFARVNLYAPKRLSFYLFEASKLVMWVTIPVAIFMAAFSEQIFTTLFLSSKFPMEKILEAKVVLNAFLIGLFCFSLNKILLNVYYVLHDTMTPMVVSMAATFANLILNRMLVFWLKAPGIAVATSISGILQTVIFIYLLHTRYEFNFYAKYMKDFVFRFIAQITVISVLFAAAYVLVKNIIWYSFAKSQMIQTFLLVKWGLWLWVGPLFLLFAYLLLITRSYFGLRMHFLD